MKTKKCDKCGYEYRVSVTWWLVWWLTLPLRVIASVLVAICMTIFPQSWYEYWKTPEVNDQSKWNWNHFRTDDDSGDVAEPANEPR